MAAFCFVGKIFFEEAKKKMPFDEDSLLLIILVIKKTY